MKLLKGFKTYIYAITGVLATISQDALPESIRPLGAILIGIAIILNRRATKEVAEVVKSEQPQAVKAATEEVVRR